jgi:hypothetical protein
MWPYVACEASNGLTALRRTGHPRRVPPQNTPRVACVQRTSRWQATMSRPLMEAFASNEFHTREILFHRAFSLLSAPESVRSRPLFACRSLLPRPTGSSPPLGRLRTAGAGRSPSHRGVMAAGRPSPRGRREAHLPTETPRLPRRVRLPAPVPKSTKKQKTLRGRRYRFRICSRYPDNGIASIRLLRVRRRSFAPAPRGPPRPRPRNPRPPPPRKPPVLAAARGIRPLQRRSAAEASGRAIGSEEHGHDRPCPIVVHGRTDVTRGPEGKPMWRT